MIQEQQGNTPNPHQSAKVGLVLFGVAGGCVAAVTWALWDGRAALAVFAASIILGLFWAVVLMSTNINHRAYMERRIVDAKATQIENESKANLIHAKNQQRQLDMQLLATQPQQPMLPAPQPSTPSPAQPQLIRVWIVPKKGNAAVAQCSTRLVQWAISDCWPQAAREYVTTDGQKVRVWKHRDQDFSEVATFMVKIGAWVMNGTSYNWREGITQQSMIAWYHTAMRGGGDVGLPESISPVMSMEVYQ